MFSSDNAERIQVWDSLGQWKVFVWEEKTSVLGAISRGDGASFDLMLAVLAFG